MPQFDILVVYDIEKFFNVKITPYARFDDEIELIYDNKIPIPALSFLNKLKGIPSIVANPYMIPEDLSIQSHILSHEVGHIINKDIYIDPLTLNKVELYEKECLADEVASEYINNNKDRFNLEPILNFFVETCAIEQKALEDELYFLNKELMNEKKYNDLTHIENRLDYIKFRIKNYKDDAINRINILQNIIV